MMEHMFSLVEWSESEQNESEFKPVKINGVFRLPYYLKQQISDETWEMCIDDTFEIQLKTVFFEGWHGGADKGEGHPAPGSLYWRSPFKEYTHWGAMAASSAAPGPKIQSDVKNYFKSGEWHKKVEAVGIDLLINRYGL